jgi:hypothetical protein
MPVLVLLIELEDADAATLVTTVGLTLPARH